MKCGARGYIAKPFDIDELVARIAAILSVEDSEGVSKTIVSLEDGNLAESAKVLQISRTTLWNTIQKYRLQTL